MPSSGRRHLGTEIGGGGVGESAQKRPMGERTAERITIFDMNLFYIRRDP